MVKRLSVGMFVLAVALGTAGLAQAQSTAQEAKGKTAAAAHKTGAATSDAEITSAVKTKLLADRKVSGLKIDVDTDNHVVTLTGPVHSAAQKAEALKVARHTHGVSRVVSKLTIEPRSARNHSPSVVDRTENGAKKTAEGVKGTTGRVADDAKSAGRKTGRVLSDAEITTAVKTKMIADTHVHAMDINVDTDNGIVTLNGTVRSAAEKAEAMKVARHTHGVKRVVDKLTVK
jgi:hyperosmotically inducible protein